MITVRQCSIRISPKIETIFEKNLSMKLSGLHEWVLWEKKMWDLKFRGIVLVLYWTLYSTISKKWNSNSPDQLQQLHRASYSDITPLSFKAGQEVIYFNASISKHALFSPTCITVGKTAHFRTIFNVLQCYASALFTATNFFRTVKIF